jgi:hypothetical protein
VELSSLVGKTVQEVRAFPGALAHPAWIDELTTPIVTSAAFIQLSDGQLLRVDPCEVESRTGGYPELGLSITAVGADAFRMDFGNKKSLFAQPVGVVAPLLPFEILSAQESDPLVERGAIEFRLGARNSDLLILRHIMPPMTLVIEVRRGVHAPNKSLERTREG